MFRNGNRLREYIENSIHVRVVSPQPITPTCTLRPLAAAVIGRHNITGADIGIHLLFPFILGLKFFPLHKILSHYIFRESCCSFVLLENLLWINYPTVEDPPLNALFLLFLESVEERSNALSAYSVSTLFSSIGNRTTVTVSKI